MQIIQNSTERDNSATHKKNPTTIRLGAHRVKWREMGWEGIHALAMQGWAAIRIGDEVTVHFADWEEGRA